MRQSRFSEELLDEIGLGNGVCGGGRVAFCRVFRRGRVLREEGQLRPRGGHRAARPAVRSAPGTGRVGRDEEFFAKNRFV